MKYEFSITKNPNPKKKPDPDTLRFGTEFTDHMFIMDYQEGEGWHDGRIVPYGPLSGSGSCRIPLCTGNV